MTKERFAEILKEYGFSEKQISLLWNTRPHDKLDEKRLREAAQKIAPTKDRLIQSQPDQSVRFFVGSPPFFLSTTSLHSQDCKDVVCFSLYFWVCLCELKNRKIKCLSDDILL